MSGKGGREARDQSPQWLRCFELDTDQGKLAVLENATRDLVDGRMPRPVFDGVLEAVKVALGIDAARTKRKAAKGVGQPVAPLGITSQGPFGRMRGDA